MEHLRIGVGSRQAGTHIFSLPPLAQSLMSALVDILRAALRECGRALRQKGRLKPRGRGPRRPPFSPLRRSGLQGASMPSTAAVGGLGRRQEPALPPAVSPVIAHAPSSATRRPEASVAETDARLSL